MAEPSEQSYWGYFAPPESGRDSACRRDSWSITKAEETIKHLPREDIIKQSLAEQERQIRAADANIRGIEREISVLNFKLTALYEERGQLRNMIAFMQKAVSYFGELQVAAEE